MRCNYKENNLNVIKKLDKFSAFWVPVRNIPEICTIQSIAFNEGFRWNSNVEGFLMIVENSIIFMEGSIMMYNADEEDGIKYSYLDGAQLLMTMKKYELS